MSVTKAEPIITVRTFSWNIGTATYSKLQALQDMILQSLNVDIIVIGLQEVSKAQIKVYKDACCDAVKKSRFRCISFNQHGGDFSLLTVILYSSELQKEGAEVKTFIPLASAHGLLSRAASKLFATKGALSIRIHFRHKMGESSVPYTFVNVHLPFDTELFTVRSIAQILSPYSPWVDENVIVFGDFNSRSLVDDNCVRNLESSKNRESLLCKGVPYKKNFNPEAVTKLEQKMNSCIVKPTRFCDKLNQALIVNDALYRNARVIYDRGFKEAALYTFPSYKVDLETGQYSLKKKREGRLAGFADRIIFKGNFTPTEYVRLSITGNDHFPISLTLIGQSPSSGSDVSFKSLNRLFNITSRSTSRRLSSGSKSRRTVTRTKNSPTHRTRQSRYRETETFV